MFQNSHEVIEYITKRTKRNYGLSEFKLYIEKMGNPQYQLRCIHVGGTNGKGSTTNYLRSILQANGYTVGTFTSPHLESHHDRIRINDVSISDEDLVRFANTYYQDWEQYGLTMFEIDMFISVMYFLEHDVDFVIYEVGLGGELDATNIIKPLVSIVTNIGYDHMDYLGNTLELISQAKAGIIKEKTPFITAERKQVCVNVFQQTCMHKQAPFIMLEDAYNVQYGSDIFFDYKSFHDVHLETPAKYQVSNASVALETCLQLRKLGVAISNEAIYTGLSSAMWKGRFEKVSTNPLVYIDGAHNEHGMQALVDTLKNVNVPITVVFSALRDKETDTMLEMLLKVTNDVIVTEFEFYRAKSATALASSYPVKVITPWQDAIGYALEHHQGMVMITGSLYFISDVRLYFKERGWIQ